MMHFIRFSYARIKTNVSDEDKNMLPLKRISFLGNNE